MSRIANHSFRVSHTLGHAAWVLGLGLGLMNSAAAQTARLGFDDQADGSVLTRQYRTQGLTMGCTRKPNVSLCQDAAMAAKPGAAQGAARSGAQVVTVAPTGAAPWPAFDERNGYLNLHFDAPVQTVTVYLKPHQPHAGASQNRPFIQAFGAGDKWLVTADYSGAVSSGADWQAVTISRPTADIRYVLVSSYASRGGEAVYTLVDDVSYSPMPVAKWTAVAAGKAYSLALRGDGSLWAWGANARGQLGLNDVQGRNQPVKLPGNDWSAVSAGLEHALALKSDGSLWAWGQNLTGQLGDGSTTQRNAPVRVGSDSDWLALAAGADHSMGIRREQVMMGERRSLWAWGGNTFGQLGDANLSGRNQPAPVPDMAQLRAVAAGEGYSLAQDSYGALFGWGYNGFGQLGQGDTQARSVVTRIDAFGQLTATSAGSGHVVLPDISGNLLRTWGMNDHGQLGNGQTANAATPQKVSAAWRDSAAAGGQHTVALQNGNTLWAWGRNSDGQLGDGSTTDRALPTRIGTDVDWAQVAAGFAHTLAIKQDGSLWAWGRNVEGQLGLRSTASQSRPQPVAGLLVQASAGTRGGIQPVGIMAAAYGESMAFQLTSEAGYTAVVTGCGGTLVGKVYTTEAISSDCAVQARFDGPRANLVPSGLVLPAIPARAPLGKPLTLSAVITNSGTLAAPASVACVQVAPTRALLIRPIELGCKTVPALRARAKTGFTYSATVPEGMSAGLWRLSVRVDAHGQVDESNETDNVVSGVVQVLGR